MPRKLASIQTIASIESIPNADNIQVCTFISVGWQCVINKKDNFKVGDMVVYCEVDSVLPEKPEFEFLRERKFRIKTIKLRKQVSQGIVFPLSVLSSSGRDWRVEGEDVTKVLGVIKHDPQLQEEKALAEQSRAKSKVLKFFMNFALFRLIYFRLNRKDKGWPGWISHSDEERIEQCLSVLKNRPNSEWYITSKIDGQSATYFIETIRKWGISKLKFGVCSRNIRLSKPDNSTYWKMAEKYDIEKKLLLLQKSGIVVQAEIAGGKIQDNKYKLPELDMFVFNVIDNGTRYSWGKMVTFCNNMGFKTVPLISESWTFTDADRSSQEIIKEITEMSIGKSALNKDIWREGIVVRLKCDPNVSFKKINPEFNLQYDK